MSELSVADKIRIYAHRMRDLVVEAYRDGVRLTVPEPDDGLDGLPLPDGFETTRGRAYMPNDGFTHLVMPKPVYVQAEAVVKKDADGVPVEIMPTVFLPTPQPLIRKTAVNNPNNRLVPKYQPSSEVFVSDAQVKPWNDPATGVLTSAIQFGKLFSVLSAAAGDAPSCPVDPAVSLKAIHYRYNGHTYKADLTKDGEVQAASVFVSTGNPSVLELDFDGDLRSDDGTMRRVHITGVVNLDSGLVQVHATSDTVWPLGYELEIRRSKIG